MFLSFLVPILSGIFGASTTTAIVGTVTSAVTAVATASAGEVLAVAGTTVATAGLVGVAEGMSQKTEKNNSETIHICKEINENKALFDQKLSADKNRIKIKKEEAIAEFKKDFRKQAIDGFDELVSSRLDAKRRFDNIIRG